MKEVGFEALARRKGQEIDFYGRVAELMLDWETLTPYVKVKEDGRMLDMPIVPGDTIGLWDGRRDNFADCLYTGKDGKGVITDKWPPFGFK